MPPPSIVILAAGASSRLGQPKALVELPGGLPIVRLVKASLLASGHTPVVVTGAHHEAIQNALESAFENGPLLGDSVRVCRNTNWKTGRTGSLIAAAAMTGQVDLCVLPVDHPRISSASLEALLAEWAHAGSPAKGWLAPGCGNPMRPGHPVVIGRGLIGLLLSSIETWSQRPLHDLRKLSETLWMLPTKEISVLENLDRPEDLERIRRRDQSSAEPPL